MVTSPTAIAETETAALFERQFGRQIGSRISATGLRKKFADFVTKQRPGATSIEIEAFETALTAPEGAKDLQAVGFSDSLQATSPLLERFKAGGFAPSAPPAPSRVDPRVIQARRTQQLRAFRKGAGRGTSRAGGVLSLLGGSDGGGFSQPSLLGL